MSSGSSDDNRRERPVIAFGLVGGGFALLAALVQLIILFQGGSPGIFWPVVATVLAVAAIFSALRWFKRDRGRFPLGRSVVFGSVLMATLSLIVAGLEVAVHANLGIILIPEPPMVLPTDTTTPSRRPVSSHVVFVEPKENLRIRPGDDVSVAGIASGLDGRSLWLVAQPDDGDYFATGPSAIATADGPWGYRDRIVGDSSDIGRGITYVAIAANAGCASSLAAANRFAKLPSECTILGRLRILVKD